MQDCRISLFLYERPANLPYFAQLIEFAKKFGGNRSPSEPFGVVKGWRRRRFVAQIPPFLLPIISRVVVVRTRTGHSIGLFAAYRGTRAGAGAQGRFQAARPHRRS